MRGCPETFSTTESEQREQDGGIYLLVFTQKHLVDKRALGSNWSRFALVAIYYQNTSELCTNNVSRMIHNVSYSAGMLDRAHVNSVGGT